MSSESTEPIDEAAVQDTSTVPASETGALDNDSDGENRDDLAGLKNALTAEREQRRKAERNAKKAHSELTRLQEANLSESEQHLTRVKREADQQARHEVRQELGSRLVKAELRAEAAGQLSELDGIVDDLDLTRLLTEDGEPNTRAIKALVGRLTKATTKNNETSEASAAVAPFPGGVRGPARTPDMNTLIRQQASH